MTPNAVRNAIRLKFEANRHISHLRTIDILLLKGHQEYQETMNSWNMNDQLLGVLLKDNRREQKTFMQKFLEGKRFSKFCLVLVG